MSRIFALVAVVLVLGAGASAIDYSHDSSNVNSTDFQDSSVEIYADWFQASHVIALVMMVGVVAAGTRVFAG